MPNLGVFLEGHAGDLLLVDRKGREPERIEQPALTIVVTIQPQVLLDIARRPVLSGRGLLARVLYCLPPDTVGFRRVKVDTVPDDVRGACHRQVKALALSLAEWTGPAVLMLTSEARRLLSGYQEEIEPRLRASGGDLADLRDWASKLAGAVTELPRPGMDRVLSRVDLIWAPDAAPHHVIYGMSGSGKTTLIKELLGLCEQARVLILDPKPAADPVWDGPAGQPERWGRPVTGIGPRFSHEGEPGGGPFGFWYRLTGGPDRADTARRFASALSIAAAEGHCVLVLDDVRETCRQGGC